MNPSDVEGFDYRKKELNLEEHAVFEYEFETSFDPVYAAAVLCMEQSTAQWKRVDVDEDFRPKHAAKIISLEVLKTYSEPLYRFKNTKGEKFHLVRAKIAHPIINFGNKIPNLLTVALGEGPFYCPTVNTIKLVDAHLPKSFVRSFEGPKLGVAGIRKMLNLKDRPIFLGVVKPTIGLNAKDFAELAYQSYLGGLDAAKDDEMFADTSYSPLKERVIATAQAMAKAEDKTGEKKMYIANITDEVDKLEELQEMVLEHGGNAVMVNTLTVGLSAVRALNKKRSKKIALFSHFELLAPLSRMPYFGLNSSLITKLERLTGCDAIINPGFGDRMMMPEEEVLQSVQACLREWGPIQPAFPIPGGSDTPSNLPNAFQKFQTKDFGMVPGRAVFNHPQGPTAGARSFREAWESIEQGIPLKEYAKNHEALRKSVEAFG